MKLVQQPCARWTTDGRLEAEMIRLFRGMPSNTRMEHCISWEWDVLVFWAPEQTERRLSTRVQILDVVSLQAATGYTHDPQGRLLLETQSSLAAGRHWSVAKAVQLIRNDARPRRWVALQRDKRAWALFWAGGGLQRCRQLLAEQHSEADPNTPQVPATADSLLRLLLDLDSSPPTVTGRKRQATSNLFPWLSGASTNPWKLVALTSGAWLVVLALVGAGLLGMVERRDRALELLLQRAVPFRSGGSGSRP
jgi:hypothetical protein